MYKFMLLLLLSAPAFAQEVLKPTNSFLISGKVNKAVTITMDSLKQYPVKEMGSFKITNHLGEFKHQDEHLKGVLLKDVLSHTIFAVGSPKLLSELYFVCTAADGYKVVYSWNELYNTAVGDQVFIITEKNGTKAVQLPENIQMASMTDFKTGRRYMHNLSRITVLQAQ
ncbi:molybdopterin-binding protein [Mucilaginibacter arboris]|uniref:Molybdopterin-binding protein n=1 Tax=Mucilaginibacter arboris TaxID=2682090 RepID=A0A7K1T1F5_9SPHI|nr:molybdopterin-binding protein [Mucilaginibacter arboris]MVN23358.1 molybdopterin-binding protein [Mucilaginibacter arboris]